MCYHRRSGSTSRVLEFTYADVMERFDRVAEVISRGLAERAGEGRSESRRRLFVTERDDSERRLKVAIDAAQWANDVGAPGRALAAANEARPKVSSRLTTSALREKRKCDGWHYTSGRGAPSRRFENSTCSRFARSRNRGA
jgi:hypothetical protein